MSFTILYSNPTQFQWVYDVYFTSSNTGFVVGEGGKILKTTNAGSTWDSTSFAGVSAFYSVHFPTANVGYAVGKSSSGSNNGPIYKTTNAGSTWLPQTSNSSGILAGLFFVNENVGDAVGDRDLVKTTNGGTSWTPILVEPILGGEYAEGANASTSSAVFFTDENTGYIVYGNKIRKTVNGGTSFTTTTIPNAFFGSVHFTNATTGYVGDIDTLTKRALILKTPNAGTDWYWQYSQPQSAVEYFHFLNADTGYAVSYKIGVSGIDHRVCILKTISGGGVTDVRQSPNTLPVGFALSQNYPNPFNPATTISFRLPSKSFASLKVFDVLGREVSILLAEELPAGKYSQQWNAAGLTSGVYFYRLQAGSFIETKKLVLFKLTA